MQRVPFPGTSGAKFFTDGDTVVKVLWESGGDDDDDSQNRRGGLLRRTLATSVLRARAEAEAVLVASVAAANDSCLLRDVSVTDGAVTVSMARGVALAETSSCLAHVVADVGPDALAAAIDCVLVDIALQLALLHDGLTMRSPNSGAPLAVGGERLRVLHGDVSPGNIVIDRDGRAHLIDFGCARWITDADVATAVPPLLASSTGGYTPQLADPRLMASGCTCGDGTSCTACAPFEREGVPVAPDGTCDVFALIASVRAWLEAASVTPPAGTTLPTLEALVKEGPLSAAALIRHVDATADAGRKLLKRALEQAAAVTASAVASLGAESDPLEASG